MISFSKQQIQFHATDYKHSGIQVSYVKSKEVLSIFGWEGNYGIEGGRISFIEFCQALGIEKKTLRKTLMVLE